MKSCIVTLGIGHKYWNGVLRLYDSWRTSGTKDIADILMFSEYPKGCPTHKEYPYAFKPYCILEAFNKGYDNVIWLDSSGIIKNNLKKYFEEIEKIGWLFFEIGYNLSDWTSDNCLSILGKTRDWAKNVYPTIWACCLGINKHNSIAMEFFNRWFIHSTDGSFVGDWSNNCSSVSKDISVKGHRHDQSVASALIHDMNLSKHKGGLGSSGGPLPLSNDYINFIKRYNADIIIDTYGVSD